jgi:hypothetical protein
MGKLAFNYLVGLKEFHMVKLAHGLEAHKNLLQDRLAMGGNLYLLIMTEFCYIKKQRVIRNEIMVFHRHPQPIMQNPQPYTKEMRKKMKL